MFRSLYNDLRRLLPSGSENGKLLDKSILLDTTLELRRQTDARPIVFDQPQRPDTDSGFVAALISAMPERQERT